MTEFLLYNDQYVWRLGLHSFWSLWYSYVVYSYFMYSYYHLQEYAFYLLPLWQTRPTLKHERVTHPDELHEYVSLGLAPEVCREQRRNIAWNVRTQKLLCGKFFYLLDVKILSRRFDCHWALSKRKISVGRNILNMHGIQLQMYHT